MRPIKYDLLGHISGSLLVTAKSTTGWECFCDCGNTVIRRSHELAKGKVKSCGQCDNYEDEGYETVSKQESEEERTARLNAVKAKYGLLPEDDGTNCTPAQRQLMVDAWKAHFAKLRGN